MCVTVARRGAARRCLVSPRPSPLFFLVPYALSFFASRAKTFYRLLASVIDSLAHIRRFKLLLGVDYDNSVLRIGTREQGYQKVTFITFCHLKKCLSLVVTFRNSCHFLSLF